MFYCCYVFVFQAEDGIRGLVRSRGLGDVYKRQPLFKEEGKSSVEIGFGCTGGMHRSVAVTETVAKELAGSNWNVSIKHREIERLDL